MNEHVVAKYHLAYGNKTIGMGMAGIMAGLIGTVLSQPADTIATKIQDSEYANVTAWKVAKASIQGKGYSSLYNGMMWRGMTLIGSVIVISSTSKKVKQIIEAYTQTDTCRLK